MYRTMFKVQRSKIIFGFTMIELLIVIAVIGILAGLFVTQYPASQRRARDAVRKSDIKQYQTAMEVYANKNNGNYPDSSGTVNISGTFCSSTLSLSTCPDDSISSVHYQVNSTSAVYVIWALMEQPPTGTRQYFVVCSNGRSGETTTQPTSSTCPTTGWL